MISPVRVSVAFPAWPLFFQVLPPLVLTSHWKEGVPMASVWKMKSSPTAPVKSAGCSVTAKTLAPRATFRTSKQSPSWLTLTSF